ncbi:SDR family oxidoreductase [Pseudorhodoferax sp. Leaf265]|jgi:NAD(P)-dependent dehydrogenase (short-subunit alcohol dehydrogenase family)|uniref:SDR family oxidoreductase n=1 Tax=Pseudorhodoferax sp. Leaf265 TaxID=1736315 RepID=UPI0007023934|nr:SDR family oxidoreductase [Pseudorhodoferax sp. Leaf265]KQP14547.1 short-chain dehydrogenase [Pseudorhodoferax sp. Leaf265]PZP91846.1 MAG: short chain dehydrogenase [Variovorax paradoxus]PZQ01841.1 MAG: short chain dehydrogenase [Variovorax paradoxus]
MSSPTLKDKVAVVTGGGKNLGALIAHLFADGGARGLVLHYNSDGSRDATEKTAAALKAKGVDVLTFQGDLSVVDNCVQLFDRAVGHFGEVNLAINTAGVVIKKPILQITEGDYEKSFAANSKAAFFFIQQAGRVLAERGSIVTIVSSLLAAYTDSYAVYPGSKAPVEHYTRAASKEFGARGISVNAIGPGPMDTPFFYGQESKESTAYHASAAALSGYSKKGLTDIEDIAPIVKFLVTEGWWITGQTIFANGGYTTR